jgi:hypothetical protein
MTCPGLERLIDYADRRLDASAAAAVGMHLASGCAGCEADHNWYERVIRIAASDNSLEPPPWVLKRALKLFENPPARRLRTRLGQIIATLVSDSLVRPALAGVRSTETDDRQLLYRAADYCIDLQLVGSAPARTDLTGQILREGEMRFESVAGLPLNLTRSGRTIRTTVTDGVGEFTIPDLPTGQYDLQVDAGEVTITVVGLTVV